MMDDVELLREYASRNSEAAFRTLVERHSSLVFSSALRQSGNRQLAEDVTQAVFVILAKKAHRLSGRTVLVGWLYRATRLACLQALRNEARRRRREREGAALAQIDAVTNVGWEQLAPELDAALGKLGKRDRDAILLRYFENLSLSEVGHALGCTDAAAKKRVSRALERLRKIVGQPERALPVVALGTLISSRAVQAAPSGLNSSACAIALAKGATGATAILSLAKHTIRTMSLPKLQFGFGILVSAFVLAGMSRVRSEPAGSVDLSFHSEFPADGLKALSIQPDGKIVFVGPFYFGFSAGGNFLYGGLGRVEPSGAVDAGFRPASVYTGAETITVQPDGKILVGGAPVNQPNLKLANLLRLNADGSVDTNFDHSVSSDYSEGVVRRIVLLENAQTLMAGNFKTVQGQLHPGLARLDSDGRIDASFQANTSPGEDVDDLIVQPDGRIVMHSYLLVSQFGDLTSKDRGLVRLNPDGSLDSTFHPSPLIRKPIALRPDGTLYATVVPNLNSPSLPAVVDIVHLNSDGSLDGTTTTAISKSSGKGAPIVGSLLVQPNGQLLIGGDFDLVDGVSKPNLARLNPDGTVDASFGLGAGLEAMELNGQGQLQPSQPKVNALQIQPDGRILIGGVFTKINGVAASGLARIMGVPRLGFVSAERDGNGLFHGTLACTDVSTVRIERTLNLRDWTTLTTLTNVVGTISFTDPALNNPLFFYRAEVFTPPPSQ